MNIGIATFQWADNYGAVIQAYALQSFLHQKGHKVEIINYVPFRAEKGIKSFLSSSITGTFKKLESTYKRSLFENFRKKYLLRSYGEISRSSDLIAIKNKFDLIFVGSDQVWNPKWLDQQEGFWDFYFLTFAGEKTKKVSFAASIGHESTCSLNKTWQDRMAIYLSSFDAISVREKSGVEIINEISDIDQIKQVLDPTLLHDSTFYYNLKTSHRKHNKSVIFSYMLHGVSENTCNFEQEIQKKLNLQIVRCDAKTTKFTDSEFTLPSPIEWLNLVSESQFVVTNSFHAVVFCLIFHTPFVAVLMGNEMGAMNSRITDLLEMVLLSYRVVRLDDLFVNDSWFDAVDWKSVDSIVEDRKLDSVEFINKCLAEC